MRRCIQIAADASSHGNHPFGSLLASPDGSILLEAENTVISDNDVTCHAETNLVRKISKLPFSERKDTVLYTSTEPCCMCCGAIIYSGVKHIVFGTSVESLNELVKGPGADTSKVLPSRRVLKKRRSITIEGPFLEDEANKVHEEFDWKTFIKKEFD